MHVVLLLAFGLSAAELSAQSSATPKNVYVPLTAPTPYSDLTVTTGNSGLAGSFTSINNLIDPDTTKTAVGPTLALLGTSWVQVNDYCAVSDPHPAGSYVGFVADDALLGLVSCVSISIYRNGSAVQTVDISNLLSVSLGGNAKIGFIANEDFDAISFTLDHGLLSLGSVQVYYAEILTPDDTKAPNLGESCNLSIPWVQSDGSVDGEGFPVVIEPVRTGADGVSLSGITGLDNVVDSDLDNSANMYQILNLLGASSSISVRTLGEPLPGGTFAGFNVSTNVVLQLGLLNEVTIRTYSGGELRDTSSGDALLVTAGLLSGTDRYTIGFQTDTDNDFDEIRITLGQGLVDLDLLNSFNVHHAVVTNFCPGAGLECRTDTAISTPNYPVFINTENTGTSGVVDACVLGDCIEDMDNLINENPNEGAV